MNRQDLFALLPMLLPALASVALLLQVVWRRNPRAGLAIASAGLVAGLLSLPIAASVIPREVTPLVVVDASTLWYQGVLLAAALGIVAMMRDALAPAGNLEEALALVLLATAGACLLPAAVHVVSAFLGIELLSVPLYALIAWRRRDEAGAEAAAKYLVLASVSAGFLLFGSALLYAGTGQLSLAGLVAAAGEGDPALVAAGVALVMVAVGFELAVVPFHLWTPDVYQGAPMPVAALLATLAKGGVVAMLARWTEATALLEATPFALALTVGAGASMLFGNLLALTQTDLKRLLAYSSIAHVGYVLVALIAGGDRASATVAFYVAAYVATSVLAFGAVSILSRADREVADLAALRGLFWRAPWLSAGLTLALLSLAGIPLTAGFVGKLLVLGTGAAASQWTLLVLLVLGSVVSVFYYLRVVAVMAVAPEPDEETTAPLAEPSRAAASWAPVWISAAALLALGVLPGPALRLLMRAAAGS